MEKNFESLIYQIEQTIEKSQSVTDQLAENSNNRTELAQLVDSKAEIASISTDIKSPYVFEFLGLKAKDVIEESDLESMKNFYLLYSGLLITPQLGEQIGAREISPQTGDKIPFDIFSIPWGHHKLLIDKYMKQPEKALFYVRKTIENGWSRAQFGNQWLPNYKSMKMKQIQFCNNLLQNYKHQ